MTGISFIGLGGMAQAIAARAVAGGNAVELIGRDAGKAEELAAALGGGATVGTFGATPVGDVVVLAVPYASAAAVAARYGDALAGKIIIDISNTFNADATALVTPDGTSGAQEIAAAVPAGAHVVKAFNTVFGHVLAQGAGWTCSSPATTRRRRRGWLRSSRASNCVRSTSAAWRWPTGWKGSGCC